MRILDMTAGNRAIWFNREYRDAVFIDLRGEVSPDVVADSCALPDQIGQDFDLIVFDPPHKNNSAEFGMARSYGSFTMDEIHRLLSGAAKEAHLVSRDNALMAFKWNDHHNKLETALSYMADWWEPLFGHGLRPQQRGTSNTSWVMLRRKDDPPPLRRTMNDEE